MCVRVRKVNVAQKQARPACVCVRAGVRKVYVAEKQARPASACVRDGARTCNMCACVQHPREGAASMRDGAGLKTIEVLRANQKNM